MRAPHSYTGEDVVEIQCHGGPILLQKICNILMAQGARLAEPGEFTRRAFLNGRLDLAQAEGVLDTIRAKTQAGLRLAQELLQGRLSNEVRSLQSTLTGLLARVEAGIDFVEEDIAFVREEEVQAQVSESIAHLERLLATWDSGRLLREGAKVVLVGRPNVGKSSLLNVLLRFDRAIVTSTPGTTRDTLEETLTIEGVQVRLVDTAGLRPTDDPVEAEGVRRTQGTMDDADLLLVVLDGSAPLSVEDRGILDETAGKHRLVVINKNDRPQELSEADRRGIETAAPSVVIGTSAQTGTGIDDLRRAILQALPCFLESREAVVVTRLRHRDALDRARESLQHAQQGACARVSAEFLSVDLRAAVQALGELTGDVTTEDLLNRIFSDFCIGK
ncbi:tRNA modification GTPase MnmE [Nitrospira sp.]|nr:tRNA modification GTPase MnmE [Nitrospira sp.]